MGLFLLLILINEFIPSKFANMKLSFLNSNSLGYYYSSYFSFLSVTISFMICFKYVFICLMVMKDVIFCTCFLTLNTIYTPTTTNTHPQAQTFLRTPDCLLLTLYFHVFCHRLVLPLKNTP